MDKKRQMVFNLNNFLLAFCELLNSKKTTYIALNLGLKFGFESEKLSDLCSYSLISTLPKQSILNFDFLNKKNLEDATFLQIVNFSKKISSEFDFSKNSINQRVNSIEFAKKQESIYGKELIDNFLDLSKNLTFFLDLENENEITMFIYSNLSDFTKVLDFEEILKMTYELHKYQNPQSEILERASEIADFFEFEHKDKYIFLIASTLQNIGKLYISNDILEKKEELTFEEKEILKSYSYHTKRVLTSIMGFSDICNIASKIQDRVDGSGTFALESKDLSFKDRLLICLIIYSALRENRAYRDAFLHSKAVEIMKNEAKDGKIDESIVDIFDNVFK